MPNMIVSEGEVLADTGGGRLSDCLPIHSAEDIDLASLVHHSECVVHDLPLENVDRTFREMGVEFLALVRGGRVIGICSRRQVGILLGARFGFALHARSPAWHAQVERPLVIEVGTPVRKVLATALARQGEGFMEDVALVDEYHGLIGLIPAEKLAHVQTRLVAEQVTSLERQYSDLLQVHEALRQAQGLWFGLFESNLLGVALFDANGTLQSHNRCCDQLLNLAEMHGTGCTIEQLLPEKDKSNLKEFLPFGRPGAAVRREQLLNIPGRGLRSFQIAAAWIGATGQVCMCLDDITDRRFLEQKMKQQEKQVLFETLAGGVAHELNNKLTPILGFSELLEDCQEEELRRTYLRCIGKSVTEAAAIIRQLLQLSRPETGVKARVDLREVVGESLVMLKFQSREYGAELISEMPDSPLLVLADAAQLKQVVMNLVINAMHAVEKTQTPRIVVSVAARNGGGLLSVSDNGSGIEPDIMTRIFDPFFTTKAPDKGSGLGLSVCMSIVRQHGGTIDVESESGRGARFIISLPECQDEAVPAIVQKTGIAPAKSEAVANTLRMLVVDDEDSVRRLVGELLKKRFNSTVDYALNGAEGLRMATAANYNLIVSDIRMPVMDGVEFYERLALERHAAARCFVFITGNASDRSLLPGGNWGKVPIIRKPFTLERMIEVCEPLIKTRHLAA